MELCETVTPVSRKIFAMVRYEACLRLNSAMLSWNGKSLPNRLDAFGEYCRAALANLLGAGSESVVLHMGTDR
jgi:uncharacterized protein YfaP (DUF2135 family)